MINKSKKFLFKGGNINQLQERVSKFRFEEIRKSMCAGRAGRVGLSNFATHSKYDFGIKVEASVHGFPPFLILIGAGFAKVI